MNTMYAPQIANRLAALTAIAGHHFEEYGTEVSPLLIADVRDTRRVFEKLSLARQDDGIDHSFERLSAKCAVLGCFALSFVPWRLMSFQ